MDDKQGIGTMCDQAREAAIALGKLSNEERNRLLDTMADALEKESGIILEANKKDVADARANEVKEPILDRLLLNTGRVKAMADALRATAKLPHVIGEVVEERTLENGLRLVQERVPLGVIAVIYESRPNVTSDVVGLCLKSGNAVILKGGKEAKRSNEAIVAALSRVLPAHALQLLTSSDREVLKELLTQEDKLDLVIPRGGTGLIRFVREHALVPVIETGTGNCHIYVDQDADLDMALRIIVNAKTQRPSVCNAAETLLVHEVVAKTFLPSAKQALEEKGVELRGCERTRAIIECGQAVVQDWDTEYLDLILAIKVVTDIEEAIAHIAAHGTRHSEAIVTRDAAAAERFLQEVDAAAVYHNASTRFTDGGEFGLGMEVGISTQKLHVRGPMGHAALTTTKYTLFGDGQVRE